jgi:hypothetical protein
MLTMTISYRLVSSERPTTSQTVPKLTTPTTSTTLIIRANISRRERNGFTADSVHRGLNMSIKFEVVMYRLRCTGLIYDCVRYMGNACHSCLKRRELSLLAEQYKFVIVQSRELLEEWRCIITELIHAFDSSLTSIS